MNTLDAYERALTLFGQLFSALPHRDQRYFIASIKTDLVYFLFALQVQREHTDLNKREERRRIFPRNFNEWRFGGLMLKGAPHDPSLFDVDQVYFRNDVTASRDGARIIALSGGLDLGRFYTLEAFFGKYPDGIVHDWRLRSVYLTSIFSMARHCRTLFAVHQFIAHRTQTNLSLVRFFQFFLYYAYHSARVRSAIAHYAKDETIGGALFSDIDNAWGNSFMLWSTWYGLRKIVYPHGSSLYCNKRRYFEPDIYYIYTTHHEHLVRQKSKNTQTVLLRPRWASQIPSSLSHEGIETIAFVTGMEFNAEIPLGNKETLLTYAKAVCEEACAMNATVYIKSHKLLDWHREYDALSSTYSCATHVRERWGMTDIQKIDIGIVATAESTMALQLLSMGIPVIVVREAISDVWFTHWSAPTFQFEVRSIEELYALLIKLKTDTNFYQQACRDARALFERFVPAARE